MRVRVEKASASPWLDSEESSVAPAAKNEFVIESEWRKEAESSFDEMPYISIRVREKKKRTTLSSVA
jgi:hypothetical protein